MAEALQRDLPCVRCGYTLRGLSEDGACPECGTAISRSLRGDVLAAADPEWLRTIARGQRLIAGGMLSGGLCIAAVVGLGITFVFVVILRPGLPRMVEDVFTWMIGAMMVGVLISLCVGAVGVYLLTAQEGRESERESPWSTRNVARWSMLAAIAALAATIATRVLPGGGAMWLVADTAFPLLLIASMTIAVVAVLKVLAVIVRRVPDEPLAERLDKRWRQMRWALPGGTIYLLMLPAFRPAAFAGGGLLLGLIACVGFIALIGLPVALFELVSITRKCASRLRICLAVAENT